MARVTFVSRIAPFQKTEEGPGTHLVRSQDPLLNFGTRWSDAIQRSDPNPRMRGSSAVLHDVYARVGHVRGPRRPRRPPARNSDNTT